MASYTADGLNITITLDDEVTAAPGGASWWLTGNAGTDSAANFIGTTDAVNLKFKVSNLLAGLIDIFAGNTSFGIGALLNTTSGMFSVAIGNSSLESSNGQYNTGVGSSSLTILTTGNANVGLGSNTGATLVSGDNNTLIGSDANVTTDSTTNAIALGYAAIAKSNQFAIPSTITSVKLGTLPEYADDAAAGSGGLVAGELYQTTTGGSSFVKIKQ